MHTAIDTAAVNAQDKFGFQQEHVRVWTTRGETTFHLRAKPDRRQESAPFPHEDRRGRSPSPTATAE